MHQSRTHLQVCGIRAGAKESSRKLCESRGDCHWTAKDVRSLKYAPHPFEQSLARGGLDEEKYAKFLEHSKTTHALGRVGQPEEVTHQQLPNRWTLWCSSDQNNVGMNTFPVEGCQGNLFPGFRWRYIQVWCCISFPLAWGAHFQKLHVIISVLFLSVLPPLVNPNVIWSPHFSSTGVCLPVDGGRHAMCPRWAWWKMFNLNEIE